MNVISWPINSVFWYHRFACVSVIKRKNGYRKRCPRELTHCPQLVWIIFYENITFFIHEAFGLRTVNLTVLQSQPNFFNHHKILSWAFLVVFSTFIFVWFMLSQSTFICFWVFRHPVFVHQHLTGGGNMKPAESAEHVRHTFSAWDKTSYFSKIMDRLSKWRKWKEIKQCPQWFIRYCDF